MDMDEDFIKDVAYIIPEFAKLANIGKDIFLAGAKWHQFNSWHSADGEEHPDKGKEVVVILEGPGGRKVDVGHWVGDVKFTVDNGLIKLDPIYKGWDQPNVKWWSDIKLI